MKIAIEARPIKWSYGTGIGNYTYCLIEKLGQLDTVNEYTFLWTDSSPDAEIPFNRKYTFYTLPKDDEREEAEIPYWLMREKAALFHLPQNGFRLPLPGPTKLVVTIHDLIPYFLPEVVRPSFLKRFTKEMPQIVERADAIVTVSETSKSDLIRVFQLPEPKITVIPSAPSAAYRVMPRPEVTPLLAEKFGLRRPFILYVGGLNPRKNVTELVYAYSKITRRLPLGHQLVIPGPAGIHLDNLRRMVGALGLAQEVVFPGFVRSDELPLLYNGADLFVYPSLYEGFGLPPIEAMRCGVPVIVSNVSSLPEISGGAALLVNPENTLELAETMARVLTDPDLRQMMIVKGLAHSQNYTWERIAREMLTVYQKVTHEHDENNKYKSNEQYPELNRELDYSFTPPAVIP